MTLMLQSEGAVLGRVRVPPFRCHAGDEVTLLLPEGWNASDEEHLFAALLMRRRQNGLAVQGTPIRASPIGDDCTPGERLWGDRLKVRRYVARRTSLVESDQIMRLRGIDPKARLRSLSWTDRFFLGFDVAVRRGDIVVAEPTLEPSRMGDYAATVGACLAKGACVVNVARPLLGKKREHMVTAYAGGLQVELAIEQG